LGWKISGEKAGREGEMPQSPSKRKKLGAKAILSKPKSKAEALVRAQRVKERQRQIAAAVAFVSDAHASGCAKGAVDRAIASHRWPQVTRSSLQRAWGGRRAKVKGDLRTILADAEEILLDDYIQLKADAAQAISRAEILKSIIILLELRQVVNRKGGAVYTLSHAALNVLRTRNVGKDFWLRFFSQRPHLKEGAAVNA